MSISSSYIIPVYHLEDFISVKNRSILDYYVKNYYLISFSGVYGSVGEFKNKYMDYIFSKTYGKCKVHGLAVTNHKLLEKYPFYSVDSSSWLNFRRLGAFYYFDRKNEFKRQYGVNYCFKIKKEVNHVGSLGYDLNKKLEITIKNWLNLEKYITELWKKKGVSYE